MSMQTCKGERYRWGQLVCLRKGRRLDVREGENGWKRGEGNNVMLTEPWKVPVVVRDSVGQICEFHSHCMQWKGIPMPGSASKF